MLTALTPTPSTFIRSGMSGPRERTLVDVEVSLGDRLPIELARDLLLASAAHFRRHALVVQHPADAVGDRDRVLRNDPPVDAFFDELTRGRRGAADDRLPTRPGLNDDAAETLARRRHAENGAGGQE